MDRIFFALGALSAFLRCDSRCFRCEENEVFPARDPRLVLDFNLLGKDYDVLRIHIVDALRSRTR